MRLWPPFPACFALVLALLLGGVASAQATRPVVMLSDIHFDPFRDPARLPQLRAAPIERWPAILSTAPSATQAADLQGLQTACRAQTLDTAWPLLEQALAAAHAAEPRPLFITASGDLLTHEFVCRFGQLTPGASAADTAAFAVKTAAFVLAQLRSTFPGVPVYAALGNNDSGCGDYRETSGDAFLRGASGALAAAAHIDPSALTATADYSVALPAPLQHARLVVLQDIFAARQYTACGGQSDGRAAETAQIDWLRAQLAQARAAGEQIWVMAHLPPGVDVYASFRRFVLQPARLCNARPQSFLADTALQDALLDHADVVRLALFGHTHMDEIRLLHRTAGNATGSETSAVPATIPAKLVPSVSPFAGNHPAFLLASVEDRTAVLKDWRTFVSPGPAGSTPPWAEAYRFTAAYHLPDFSAASALTLADALVVDKTGQGETSSAFRQHFYPGDLGLYALGLAQIWPAYACSVREDRPSAVRRCLCEAVPLPPGDAKAP